MSAGAWNVPPRFYVEFGLGDGFGFHHLVALGYLAEARGFPARSVFDVELQCELRLPPGPMMGDVEAILLTPSEWRVVFARLRLLPMWAHVRPSKGGVTV